MKLSDLKSLKLLTILGYMNIIFTLCALINFEVFYDLLEHIFARKIPMLSLDKICEIYIYLTCLSFFLIIAAVFELFHRKKNNIQNSTYEKKTFRQICVHYISSFMFYFGLLSHLLFITLYTFSYIMIICF